MSDRGEAVEAFFKLARGDAFARKAGGGDWRTISGAISGEDVARHVAGGVALAAFPFAPGRAGISFATLDFDDHGEKPEPVEGAARRVIACCRRFGLMAWPVRSGGGRGVHLHFRWDHPVDAGAVRRLLATVLAAEGLSVGARGVALGEVEILPKQDFVAEGDFGSHVSAPFGRKSVPLDLELREVAGVLPWVSSAPPRVVEAPKARREEQGGGSSGEAVAVEGGSLRSALRAIDASSFDVWIRVGLALKNDLGDEGFELWDMWSSEAANYPGKEALAREWSRMRPKGSVSAATVFYLAREAGWKGDGAPRARIVEIYAAGAEGRGRAKVAARIATALLARKLDPGLVLGIVRDWNAARARPALADEEVVDAVDGAAGKVLEKIMKARKR